MAELLKSFGLALIACVVFVVALGLLGWKPLVFGPIYFVVFMTIMVHSDRMWRNR